MDLGLGAAAPTGPLRITSSRMAHLRDSLVHAYRVLGFEEGTGGDAVFAQPVLARIIEPSSKLDSARVLEEAGVVLASYPMPGPLIGIMPGASMQGSYIGLVAVCGTALADAAG